MIPFARVLNYGNVAPHEGFKGTFGYVTPDPGGYVVEAQNRPSCTSYENKIYLIGGALTSSGSSGKLVEYDVLTNEYKLINEQPNSTYSGIPCYVGGYVYIIYFPTFNGSPRLRRVNVSTGVNEELGACPYAYWCTGLITNSSGTALYTVNRNNYRLQRYDIGSATWDIPGTANFGTYTSDCNGLMMGSNGYIYMLTERTFVRTDPYGSAVVQLTPAPAHAPFSGFYSSLFEVEGYIYAYSYSILQRYHISTNTWEFVSDGTPVVGALTTNAVGCFNTVTNMEYLFYAAVGSGAKNTKVGIIR